jgi:predicted ATP-grasp superfamily ATP-dependent carboligase
LLLFGEREPRHVLLSTSDDVAWLLSANATELGKRFAMFQPARDTMARLLDKKSLHDLCRSVGLDTVPTWFPESEGDAQALAPDLPFPVILKARTQVMRARQTKGVVVHRAQDLAASWRRYVAADRFRPEVADAFGPSVHLPMVQAFIDVGPEAAYSLAGFIDCRHDLFATRGSIKVLQRTLPVGLGVAFEAAPVDETLARGVRALCEAADYFGVFEVEFVRNGGRSMVIDFNPRFYGQMGFDVKRGLPLPMLAYHAAAGEDARVRTLVSTSVSLNGEGAEIYAHRVVFELLLLARRLGGSLDRGGWARWRQWYADHRAADASSDARDWLPGVVHVAAEVLPGLRVLRRIVLDRTLGTKDSSPDGSGTVG